MKEDENFRIYNNLDTQQNFRYKYLLFGINFFPFIHTAITFLFLLNTLSIFGFGVSIVYFYFFPPFLARLLLRFFPIHSNSIKVESNEFTYWWILFQLQIVFSRLFFLEELLRLVPGLYSIWLRSWGSKIGSFVIWSPGVRIYDRTMLVVGNNVVLGAGAQISSHLYSKQDGESTILFDKVVIGTNVILGGNSIIGPGVVIHDGEITPATLLLPPYSHFKDNKRIKIKSNNK
jgi:acetyltransferase-like isoleucine patch superfamily enzyme